MENFLSRTELLIGKDAIEKLKNSHIAIFGIGGVGGYTAEALIRCGIENIDLIDCDVVQISNINRQIYATVKTIGKYKVDVAKERILEINPNTNVQTYKLFFEDKNKDEFKFKDYDYVVDAIDTVKSKIALIEKCKSENIKIISSMGAGNKMHPEMFEIADISKTSVCPLARVMRIELKKRNIKNLKVIYSKEKPLKFNNTNNKRIPASISFTPSAAGLIIASVVVQDLINSV